MILHFVYCILILEKIESKEAEDLLQEVQNEFNNLLKEDHKNEEQISKCIIMTNHFIITYFIETLKGIIDLFKEEFVLMKEDISTTKKDVNFLNEKMEVLERDVTEFKGNKGKDLCTCYME